MESVPEKHRKDAPKSVDCAVLTFSDTRSEETDESGKLIKKLLIDAGHVVTLYRIVKEDSVTVREAVLDAIENATAIITNGGTGLGSRDITAETVRPLLDKEIEGFGELFRTLSYQEVGPAAMLSRPFAGVKGSKVIVCLPGSPAAVRLALEKLLLPELGHIVREVSR